MAELITAKKKDSHQGLFYKKIAVRLLQTV